MRLYSCYHFQWNHISALINIYIYALNAARSTRKIVSVWKNDKELDSNESESEPTLQAFKSAETEREQIIFFFRNQNIDIALSSMC